MNVNESRGGQKLLTRLLTMCFRFHPRSMVSQLESSLVVWCHHRMPSSSSCFVVRPNPVKAGTPKIDPDFLPTWWLIKAGTPEIGPDSLPSWCFKEGLCCLASHTTVQEQENHPQGLSFFSAFTSLSLPLLFVPFLISTPFRLSVNCGLT